MDGWETTTAMHQGILRNELSFCKKLIELGVNPTATPRTPDSHPGVMEDEYSVETSVLEDGKMPYETSSIFLAAKYLPDLIISELSNLAPSLAQSLLPVAVQAGMDIPEISELLSRGADINGIDGRLWTALHYAISREDVSLTHYLLDNGASPDGRSSESAVPLHTALDPAQAWPLSFLLTPLVLAVKLNNSVLCEILIEAQANVNLSMKDKLPGFFESDMADLCESYFSAPQFDFTWYIKDREADNAHNRFHYPRKSKSARWCNLWTAIEVAAADGFAEIAELLLWNGADLQMECTSSPLAFAAAFGHVEDVELLLDYGAHPQYITNDGCELSALQVACLRGDAEIVSILIEADAIIDDPDMAGPTPLQCAAMRGNVDIVRDLLRRGAGPDAVPDTYHGLMALQGAISYDRKEVFECLLEYWDDTNALPGKWDDIDDNGTLLSVAVSADCSDYLLRLLELKLDLDHRLRCGYTRVEVALLKAARRGRCQNMRILLREATFLSPDVLTKALNMVSPDDSGAPDIMRTLLDRGGILRQTKPSVLCTESLEEMKTLLARGADVNEPAQEKYRFHRTALQNAISRRDLPMTKFLLEMGANINAPPSSMSGQTAFQEAVFQRDLAMTKFLLEKGADINAPPVADGGRTALQIASENGDIAIFKLLLEHGADVNAPPAETGGVTALQAASIGGYLGIAEILIQAGADIGAPASSEEGRTALNGAAEHGRLDMVKLLLDNYRLKDGESLSQLCDEAVGYAKRELHWGSVELLEKYQRPPNLSP
ncbi:uncharacterized protein PV06_07712 [Exophiala oligosperma]|uniref:Uncharacterized protein n=1 Tax=Exophiala oligosperma TaxID=215243 RepID=A0A0D2BSW2_9EURO|nr:uncharacterized protein PV06_07712 [Exophiala oligosperma]KIW40522.1 hypothetical protein PV06_07712 [Exophiala oligosperma]